MILFLSLLCLFLYAAGALWAQMMAKEQDDIPLSARVVAVIIWPLVVVLDFIFR